MKKSAFTLIELLVVISIIAILAGIALPVFGRVTEKANSTADMNNQRSIGIGTMAFLNDNEDQFFKAADDWSTLLHNKYVPDWKVFKSPFDKFSNNRASGGSYAVSYGANDKLCPASASPTGTNFTGNMSQLVASSQLIMYCPSYGGDPTTQTAWTNKSGGALTTVKAGGVGMTKGTHVNGKQINAVYADSHVGSMLFKDFQTTADNSATNGVDGLKQWNPLGQ